MSKVNQKSLSQWLKKNDRKLYEAIEDACALTLLRPERGSNGITLLYPVNKALRNKIISLLEYNDFEGIRILQTLIIVDCLHSTRDWHDKKDDIPNKLGNIVEITSIDNTTVRLSNGAILKLIEPARYAQKSEKGNIAIWSYNEKEPPPVEGKTSKHKYIRKGAKPAIKQDDEFNNIVVTPYRLAKICEAQAFSLLNSRSASAYIRSNPYITMLVSFMAFLDRNYQKEFIRNSLKLSYSPEASFYIIFEPYCRDKNGKPTEEFDRWIETTRGSNLFRNPSEKYKKYVENAPQISKARELRETTRRKRRRVIKDVYPAVLRKALVKAYDGNDERAQHDEIRFLVHDKLYDIIRSGRGKAHKFKDLIFEINMMQRSGYTEGKNIVTNSISPVNDALDYASFCSTVVTFALSDCFLYVPYSTNIKWEYYKELSERNDGSFLDQIDTLDVELENLTNDLRLIITQQDALGYLDELIGNQKSNRTYNTQSRMTAMFKSLKHDDIDPELISSMSAFFEEYKRRQDISPDLNHEPDARNESEARNNRQIRITENPLYTDVYGDGSSNRRMTDTPNPLESIIKEVVS